MSSFLLETKNSDLTRALKLLRRADRICPFFYLKHNDGVLTISVGNVHQDLAASGCWPEPVRIERHWAETLADNPYEAARLTMRVVDGKLLTREFKCPCTIAAEPDDEEARRRTLNVESAARLLSTYGITERDVEQLIERASAAKASLWSPDDDKMANHIARAWLNLFSYGVEPGDIRQAIHGKSRDLWKNPPVRGRN